ncbi:hypothetical protein HG535_0F04610 [Zygotorulaspora mrakii]|uniref:Nonsense-mediated mRNA decay factor n=1 Tax=Zygotorulaspora mrakii TaxID=42260 RepID=A0A7H9B7J0_ZYGMR|nr:uncharacterized protein HG535_0F04610 [Zygotorulaspora mrakii]QLG73949.1 hypothetical protein HG535_0F04610 [Zygotorulaspora mrakii]
MTVTPSDAEKNVWDTISELHNQLNATIQSKQIIEDYALLSGFLTFVDSKLSRMISESLQMQQAIYEDTVDREVSHSHVIRIDNESVPLILRLYWEKICHPIFKWFQAWRAALLSKDSKEQRKHVEFRKMNSKLTKFFKSVHKFYYRIIDDLLSKYDTSAVIAAEIIKQLCAGVEKEGEKKIVLDAKSNFTILIVVSLHSCLLNLGSAHRYKSIAEKFSNHYVFQDFKKSMRYLDLACLILPSIGEAHLQKGLIYVQIERLGAAMYEFIRSSLARIPNNAAQANFATIIAEKDSRLRKRLDILLKDINAQDLNSSRIVNREIIEYYFLAIFGSYFAPQCWLNSAKSKELQNGISLEYLKKTLKDKMSTRYLKNIDTIYEDLIVLIGGFDLLLLSSDKGSKCIDIKTISLKTLKAKDHAYLEFAFSFVTDILKIVRESWEKNIEKYQYLAMVRVVECWLKSNRAVLQYSHRNESFCRALAELLNDILRSQKVHLDSLMHRPKRSYYMEEDVDLKEMSTIKYALSDFNDDHIFSMGDCTDRSAGFPPPGEKLDAQAQSILRLQAIFVSGKKFLAKNSCGVEWSNEDMVFKFPTRVKQVKRLKPDSWASVLSKKEPDSVTIAEQKSEHDYMIAQLKQNVERGGTDVEVLSQGVYSGSSAPMPPTTFTIKPSSKLTADISKSSILNAAIDVIEENSLSSTDLAKDAATIEQKLQIPNSPDVNDRQEILESAEHKAAYNEKSEHFKSIFNSGAFDTVKASGFQEQTTLPSIAHPSAAHNIGFNPAMATTEQGVQTHSAQMWHPGYGMSPMMNVPLVQTHHFANDSSIHGWISQYPQQVFNPQVQQHQQQHQQYPQQPYFLDYHSASIHRNQNNVHESSVNKSHPI